MSGIYLPSLADAQRKAFQILKNAASKSACKQDVVLHRSDVKTLNFEIQDGIESISKLSLIRRNIMSIAPGNFKKLLFKMTGTINDTSFDYAEFICGPSESIVLNGQPFPLFMFPEFKFKITILPVGTDKLETDENIIMDYDIVAETIIHTREVLDDKKLKLSELSDNPKKYKFRCDQLIKFYPNEEIAMQQFNPFTLGGNQFMMGGTTFYPANDDSSKNKTFDLARIYDKIFGTNISDDSCTHLSKKLKIENPSTQTAQTTETREYKTINTNIQSITDLIKLIDDKPEDQYEYAIDISKLSAARSALVKLNEMIGMKNIKDAMVEWILYFLSGLHRGSDGQFMNIVLTGTPGIGKTHVSEILAEIFSSIGAVKENKLHKVAITDLVGKYTGQSEHKTTEILNKAKDGIILIDEAYAIARSGDEDKPCAFGAKVLDIINKFLGENPKTIMIIAGYKEMIEKSFFSVNNGLRRRFPWNFELENYSESELVQILKYKGNRDGYEIDLSNSEKIEQLIKTNKELFKYNGGDMANILTKALSIHCKNILSVQKLEKNIITSQTIFNAFKMYIDAKLPKTIDLNKNIMMTMYS
jgi:hypothetical protein